MYQSSIMVMSLMASLVPRLSVSDLSHSLGEGLGPFACKSVPQCDVAFTRMKDNNAMECSSLMLLLLLSWGTKTYIHEVTRSPNLPAQSPPSLSFLQTCKTKSVTENLGMSQLAAAPGYVYAIHAIMGTVYLNVGNFCQFDRSA